MMRSGRCCKIVIRVMAVLGAACLASFLANLAVAEDTPRPRENKLAYAYQGKGMKGYGKAVNADPTRLGRLFATALELQQKPSPEGAPWLGVVMKRVAPQPNEHGAEPARQAVEISRVMPGSGAEAAGILAGDLIVGINGEPIADRGDKTLLAVREAVSRKHPGEKLQLRILRGEQLLEAEVTLSPYPRVASVLKPHPDLERKWFANDNSWLRAALEKEGLTDEFTRLGQGLRNEADKVVSLLVRKDNYNPFRFQEVNYILYHPLQLPVVARRITDRLQGAFGRNHHDLGALLRTAMDELDMAYIPAPQRGSKPPADLAEYVERLLKAIQHANAERAAVLSVLDAGEIDFLYATAPELLEGESDAVKEQQSDAEKQQADQQGREAEARLLKLFQIVLKLDLPRLLNAAAGVAQALDLETLKKLDKTRLTHYPPGRILRQEKNLTVIDTAAGRVLIGGKQANTYTEDAALILDFGGNDTYLNHGGGSTRLNPFSVVIDLSGDDVYSAAEDFAQGAGMLGGGFLVDLKGSDRYTAKNHSQGAGILGVGMLVDLAGQDQYTAISAAQGVGSYGIGMLAEGGGDDSYVGNYFVQGGGGVRGFGAIVEAAGNDSYFAGGLYEDMRAPGKAYKSMSQGFGFGIRPFESFVGASGGIGVIAEGGGNDVYVADYFAQGSSYWFALGILDDRNGSDRYVSGRYSQGAGIHMSAGVLLDGGGDDNYFAGIGVAQGCGHDYGIGFLLDNGGNDHYVAGSLAQGVGNDNGIGVLSDNGGNDEYSLQGLGQGHGNYEPSRDLGSFGLLFDTGGTDSYSLGGRNDSLHYKTRWGILLDSH